MIQIIRNSRRWASCCHLLFRNTQNCYQGSGATSAVHLFTNSVASLSAGLSCTEKKEVKLKCRWLSTLHGITWTISLFQVALVVPWSLGIYSSCLMWDWQRELHPKGGMNPVWSLQPGTPNKAKVRDKMHGQRLPVAALQGCRYEPNSLLLAHIQRAPLCLSTFPKANQACHVLIFFVCLFALPSKEEIQKNKEKCVKWNYLSRGS